MLLLNAVIVVAGRLGLQGVVFLPPVCIYNGSQGNVLVFCGCYGRSGCWFE